MKSISHSIKKTRVLVDYLVVNITTCDGTSRIVSLSNRGYEMHGQPFCHGHPGISVQAMVKYEDKTEAVISEREDGNEIPN